MPQYTLVYFEARGRAELSRLLFAQAGVEYKDVRISYADWPSHKAEAPLGQLPYLCVDGVKIGQSLTIARFLAREFGFFGKTNLESARIDMIFDTVCEFVELAAQAKWSDEKWKADKEKDLKEKAPHYIDLLAKLLQQNEGGFYVGTQVSLADFIVYNNLQWLAEFLLAPETVAILEKNEVLQQHTELIGKLPRIAEWVAKRPVTDM